MRRKGRIPLTICVALIAAVTLPALVQAKPILGPLVQPVALEDRNSKVVIDPADYGMVDWFVDDVDHLYQQWFWYRLEGMSHEKQLEEMPFVGASTSDTNFVIDPCDDTMTAYYGDLQGFYVETKFALQGGLPGSGASDVAEQIGFYNHTDETVKLWFFQYTDLDLNGTPDNDTARIQGGNTAYQIDAEVTASESVVTPMPTRYEVNFYPNTLVSLDDNAITILNNNPGPLAGDVTWAFEWEIIVPPDGSVTISKDKNLIPEPATVSLLLVGTMVTLIRRKGCNR